jgi:hypothetical protein
MQGKRRRLDVAPAVDVHDLDKAPIPGQTGAVAVELVGIYRDPLDFDPVADRSGILLEDGWKFSRRSAGSTSGAPSFAWRDFRTDILSVGKKRVFRDIGADGNGCEGARPSRSSSHCQTWYSGSSNGTALFGATRRCKGAKVDAEVQRHRSRSSSCNCFKGVQYWTDPLFGIGAHSITLINAATGALGYRVLG